MNNEMKIVEVKLSNDSVTKKYVQITLDNHQIETTFVNYKNKYIVCFSSQIGCNIGCKFCYNGIKHNFIRNLTSKEIICQIENVLTNEILNEDKPILFSAMGIGEPLLNYDNVVKSILYLDQNYINSKFALATSGIGMDYIDKLGKDLKEIKNLKLMISLHCADQIKRNSLMPTNVDVTRIVNVVNKFQKKYNREVEWNFVLFENFNDSPEDAKKIVEILGNNQKIKINKYNKVLLCDLKGSNMIKEFVHVLQDYGMKVEYYETNGDDIDAACGQMISK